MFIARRVCLAAALLLVVAGGQVYAQTDTGTVDGRVFDEQKAAMPGVTVTAKNTATGFTRTATTGGTGTYHIEALPPGTYDVSAEIQGFSTQLRRGVAIQVGTSAVIDFTMRVGNLQETVTVTGEVPLVQTTKSDVGQLITAQMVESMPLNGRKFQDLSLLVPGTRSSNSYDPTKTEVGGVSYGGGTGRSVNISVDGGDNNDGVVRGILQQFSADAIQEYKVTTQRYSAEFGRSVGGVVNVITKSGTNDLRGSAFVFARNEKLNSPTYFQKEAGIDKQPFSQQQVGGTFGGPIRKDKAFYFVSYEFNRRNDYQTVYTNGVLPEEEGPQLTPFRNHMLTAKTNFQLGSNNSLLVRYAREDQKREHDFIGGGTLASGGALNTNVIDSIIAKDSAVIGGSKLNELLVLFQNFENNIIAEDPSKPAITTPNFTFGANINTPQQTIQRRWQIKDDFSFRKEGWLGDHDFKTGGELIQSHYGGYFIPTLYGFFNFVNEIPGGNLDSYLNAVADTFTGSAGTNEANDNWTYVAGYFQDDWKPRSNLTVNLGLRYEVQAGPYDNAYDTLALRAIAAAGRETERKLDRNNFGPRVGVVWDVKGDAKTVVRAGYGTYYDEIFQNITLYEKWSDVRTPVFFVSASPPPFTAQEYINNRESIRNSFLDPTFSGQLLRLTAPDLVQPYSHHFNAGFSQQLMRNVSLDVDYVHALGRDEIHRWRINTAQNVNTRLSPAGVFAPNLGAIIVEGNRGRSTFDGLYVTGKVRMPRISLISTYSWSKAENLSNDFGSQPHDITNADWEMDWGYAPNDVTHRFTTGAVFSLPHGIQYSTSIQANTGRPYNALTGQGGLRNAVRAVNPATGQVFERNSFRAGGFASWDMRFSKEFMFPNRRALEVLFEVFNLTDHVNFDRDNYVTTFSDSNFGRPQDIIRNSERQAEFGIRFKF